MTKIQKIITNLILILILFLFITLSLYACASNNENKYEDENILVKITQINHSPIPSEQLSTSYVGKTLEDSPTRWRTYVTLSVTFKNFKNEYFIQDVYKIKNVKVDESIKYPFGEDENNLKISIEANNTLLLTFCVPYLSSSNKNINELNYEYFDAYIGKNSIKTINLNLNFNTNIKENLVDTPKYEIKNINSNNSIMQFEFNIPNINFDGLIYNVSKYEAGSIGINFRDFPFCYANEVAIQKDKNNTYSIDIFNNIIGQQLHIVGYVKDNIIYYFRNPILIH